MGFLSGIKKMLPGGEAESAAGKQVDQSKKALALQRQMFNAIRDDAAPLRALRDTTLPQLLATQGIGRDVDRSRFMVSPEYRQTYGAASSVADNLPGTAPPGLRNALLDRAGNIALGEYENFYNRLANIGGFSSKGIGLTNNQMQDNINAQTGLLNDAGAAAASGIMGAAQARGNAAGAGASILSAFLSDARVKEHIHVLGSDQYGRIVRFNYCGDSVQYIGRIAQDLLETDPANVIKSDLGLLMVTEKHKPMRIL